MDAWRVGASVVRPSLGSVEREGVVHRLEPKVMAVLVCLIERRGEVVSKHDLLSAVWPDTFVEEVALARSVSEIRRAFGDDAHAPRYVETLARRGYRLVAGVALVGAEVAATPASGPPDAAVAVRRGHSALVRAVGIAVIVLPAIAAGAWWSARPPASPVVAVLPFITLELPDGGDYIGAGLTEDVVAALSGMAGVRVISARATAEHSAPDRSAAAIAAALDATAALDGTIRRDGDRVRVVAKLVDRGGAHLWAESVDGSTRDLFGLQETVARRVAAALDLRIAPAASVLPAVDRAQYDTYLQARAHYQRVTRVGVETAIDLLTRVVDRDPSFVLARAALADALARRGGWDADAVTLQRAVAEARRAVADGPAVAEAHKSLGHAWGIQGRIDLAIPSYETALRLRPGYWPALNNLALSYYATGALDRAVPLARLAAELDPASPLALTNAGEMSVKLGLDAEAERWYSRALAIEPYYADAHDGLFQVDLHAGRLDRARARLQRVLGADAACATCLHNLALVAQISGRDADARDLLARRQTLPGNDAFGMIWIARIDRRAGREREARAALRDIQTSLRQAFERGVTPAATARWLAAAHAVFGETAEAAEWLRRAVDAGRRDYRWDAVDPAFELVRSSPAFQAEIARMRAAVEAMRGRAAPG